MTRKQKIISIVTTVFILVMSTFLISNTKHINASDETGSLHIHSVDIDQLNTVVPNVAIQLVNIQTGETFNYEIGEQGSIEIHGLTIGVYQLFASTSDLNYTLINSENRYVYVSNLGLHETLLWKQGNVEQGILVFQVIDYTNKVMLPGVRYNIVNDNTGTQYTIESDANGLAILQGAEYGQYSMQSIEVPEGYIFYDYGIIGSPIVSIQDGTGMRHAVGYVFVVADEATLTINKVDAETKLSLSDAEFTIKDLDGNIITTVVTVNGSVTVKLPFGVYEVSETVSPKGYQLSGEVQVVDLSMIEPQLTAHECACECNCECECECEATGCGEDELAIMNGTFIFNPSAVITFENIKEVVPDTTQTPKPILPDTGFQK